MFTVVSLVMFIIFLLGASVFASSKILSIIGMILAVGLFLINILYKKNILDKKIYQYSAIAFIILFALSIFTGMDITKGGLLDYEQRIDSIRNLIERDKISDARKKIEDLEKDFGNSDNIIMLETLALVGERKFKDAISHLKKYSDNTSPEYYSIMEAIYYTENNPNSAKELGKLYIEAADKHPEWTHMQKRGGMAQLDNENYATAEYLFLRAYEQDPLDYETAYYLGVACYEQSRIEEALNHFDEAINLGADEEVLGYIAWYAEQVTK